MHFIVATFYTTILSKNNGNVTGHKRKKKPSQTNKQNPQRPKCSVPESEENFPFTESS